jgi:UDP-glucuronate 4-epimerase
VGFKARKNFMPIQAGDVPATWADMHLFGSLMNFNLSTDISKGAKNFVDWYRSYYNQ